MEFDLRKPYCYYFNEICKIPHGSYHEKAISDYVVSFAKEHHLRYVQDAMWNVVIYKDASDGYYDYSVYGTVYSTAGFEELNGNIDTSNMVLLEIGKMYVKPAIESVIYYESDEQTIIYNGNN